MRITTKWTQVNRFQTRGNITLIWQLSVRNYARYMFWGQQIPFRVYVWAALKMLPQILEIKNRRVFIKFLCYEFSSIVWIGKSPQHTYFILMLIRLTRRYVSQTDCHRLNYGLKLNCYVLFNCFPAIVSRTYV